MNQKIVALKAIQNALSRKGVQAALATIGQPPSNILAQELAEEKRKKGFRILLTVISSVLILAVTYFSFIGGGYIAEYAGPMALIFGILDLTIVFLLFADAVKGKLRFVLILFEILSLAYLGYAMSGYFGGGNLRTAAEKKIVAAYNVAKEHFTAATATADLMKRNIANAGSVAEVEAKRDGKGVVFEKASFIASMKPDSLTFRSALPQVPLFDDLTTANKWLQNERQKVTDQIGHYDASNEAMKNQAKGMYQSLQDALKMTLSPQQTSNLQVLAASMQEIANKEALTSKITDEVLKPSDLKADGFQSFIGYIIDGVIIFFIFMLAIQKSSDKRIEEIKDQEMKSLMESILSDAAIAYDPQAVTDVPMARQYEILKTVFASEDLQRYLKTKISFDEYVRFSKEHPQLARKLGVTNWQLSEIKSELANNASFAGIADSALELTSAEWKMLNMVTDNPEDLFKMKPEDRAKFLKALKFIQTKTNFKSAELKNFVNPFLLVEEPTDEFMKNFEECASSLNAEKLTVLTIDFVKGATPKVVKYLCEHVEHKDRFQKIVNGWNQNIDASFTEILSNGIVESENFDRFMGLILNQAGLAGLKKVINAYNAKKREGDDTMFGNKVLVLKPNFAEIKKAIQANNDEAVISQLDAAFVIENEKID